MLRQLREDARDYPATMVLGALWVVVFVLMVANHWAVTGKVTAGDVFLGFRGGHPFGDLTIRDFNAGEGWRTVTATFVHYGLIHLGLNLYALYHLGCLVESWYGPGFFVGVYVLTGGVGNLISVLCRRALDWNPSISSAGGSVVVMGLVGLCAVVGWRSGTRLGDYLRNQMLWVIFLTAGLGAAFVAFGYPIFDNWGHGCGAAVGAVLGFGNRWMVARSAEAPARWSGRLGGLVLLACAFAQVADNRADGIAERAADLAAVRAREDAERHSLRLAEIQALYRTVTLPRLIVRGSLSRAVPRPSPGGPPTLAPSSPDPDKVLYESVLKAALAAFDSMKEALDAGASAADFGRARGLLVEALRDPPTLEEFRDFERRVLGLQKQVRADLETAFAEARNARRP